MTTINKLTNQIYLALKKVDAQRVEGEKGGYQRVTVSELDLGIDAHNLAHEVVAERESQIHFWVDFLRNINLKRELPPPQELFGRYFDEEKTMLDMLSTALRCERVQSESALFALEWTSTTERLGNLAHRHHGVTLLSSIDSSSIYLENVLKYKEK